MNARIAEASQDQDCSRQTERRIADALTGREAVVMSRSVRSRPPSREPTPGSMQQARVERFDANSAADVIAPAEGMRQEKSEPRPPPPNL